MFPLEGKVLVIPWACWRLQNQSFVDIGCVNSVGVSVMNLCII